MYYIAAQAIKTKEVSTWQSLREKYPSKDAIRDVPSVWKLAAPTLVACAKCGALHLPHRMCPECGSYNGREVKVVKSVAAK